MQHPNMNPMWEFRRALFSRHRWGWDLFSADKASANRKLFARSLNVDPDVWLKVMCFCQNNQYHLVVAGMLN
jgi:hypothetical protein